MAKHLPTDFQVDLVDDLPTERERKLPNLQLLSAHLLELLTYLNDPETKQRMKINENQVLNELNNKYVNTIPYGMLRLLMDPKERKKNVKMILDLIERMRRVENNEISLDDAEGDFMEVINSKYLYSQFGGKEKFEKLFAK